MADFIRSAISPAQCVERYIGPACKFFLPCNEGSGTTFTDLIGGLTFADASATHLLPHSASWGFASAVPTSGSNTFTTGFGHAVLCLSNRQSGASVAFHGLSIGEATTGKDLMSLAEGFVTLDTGGDAAKATTNSSGSPGDGDDVFIAATADGTTLTHYRSINGSDLSTPVNTVDISTTTLSGSTSGKFTINSTFTRQGMHAAAVFLFASALPTDVVAGLQLMANNWRIGNKILPPTWRTLA